MANGNGKLPPIQQKMLDILSDGLEHSPRELHECLYDDAGRISNIQMHISNLRKHVHKRGLEIVCRVRGYAHTYQMFRRISRAE